MYCSPVLNVLMYLVVPAQDKMTQCSHSYFHYYFIQDHESSTDFEFNVQRCWFEPFELTISPTICNSTILYSYFYFNYASVASLCYKFVIKKIRYIYLTPHFEILNYIRLLYAMIKIAQIRI